MVRLLSSIVALVGAILVGWNAMEIYYLATGRVQPDFEQPPMGVVVVLLIIGLVLLGIGFLGSRKPRKDRWDI